MADMSLNNSDSAFSGTLLMSISSDGPKFQPDTVSTTSDPSDRLSLDEARHQAKLKGRLVTRSDRKQRWVENARAQRETKPLSEYSASALPKESVKPTANLRAPLQSSLSSDQAKSVEKAMNGVYKDLYHTGQYRTSDLPTARGAFANPSTNQMKLTLAEMGLDDTWQEVSDSAMRMIDWCEHCEPPALPKKLEAAIKKYEDLKSKCEASAGYLQRGQDFLDSTSPKLLAPLRKLYNSRIEARKNHFDKVYKPEYEAFQQELLGLIHSQEPSKALHKSTTELRDGLEKNGIRTNAAITQSLEDTWIKQILFGKALEASNLSVDQLPR